MTRKEAYKLREQGFSNEHNMLIDAIYDDFESRTCENCKHFIDEKGTKLQFCNARTAGGIIGWNGYGKDFGCNKFSCEDYKV